MKQTLGCIRKADQDWNLIEEGDKIAVGLSGGKDSLLLLKALRNYRQFSKKQFTLVAITVDLGLRPFDLTPVLKFCQELNVPYYVEETQIGEIIFDIRKEKNPCSLCAKMRKGVLYDKAKALGCNKVALGHHKDDLIDTFFLSMIYEGKLNALKPIFYLSRVQLTVIRPLIYLPEAHILGAIGRFSLPVTKSPCPANGHTKRDTVRDLIRHLQIDHPDVKDKIFTAIYNQQYYQLWSDKNR